MSVRVSFLARPVFLMAGSVAGALLGILVAAFAEGGAMGPGRSAFVVGGLCLLGVAVVSFMAGAVWLGMVLVFQMRRKIAGR